MLNVIDATNNIGDTLGVAITDILKVTVLVRIWELRAALKVDYRCAIRPWHPWHRPWIPEGLYWHQQLPHWPLLLRLGRVSGYLCYFFRLQACKLYLRHYPGLPQLESRSKQIIQHHATISLAFIRRLLYTNLSLLPTRFSERPENIPEPKGSGIDVELLTRCYD